MGFPYGDALYGRGLYSRRPDWWRDKSCYNNQWAAKTCQDGAWAASGTDTPTWGRIAATRRRSGVSADFKAVGTR